MADLHVVLVHPEIAWNTGNVGRTCLAVGAQLHLVSPLGFSLSDRQVRRAGLDYWERVQPQIWSDWDAISAALPELADTAPQPWIFTADATREYWAADFTGPTVLVFGCESVGLPAEIRAAHADRALRIPMHDPQLRSLNLSTSVALACYEVLRQRR